MISPNVAIALILLLEFIAISAVAVCIQTLIPRLYARDINYNDSSSSDGIDLEHGIVGDGGGGRHGAPSGLTPRPRPMARPSYVAMPADIRPAYPRGSVPASRYAGVGGTIRPVIIESRPGRDHVVVRREKKTVHKRSRTVEIEKQERGRQEQSKRRRVEATERRNDRVAAGGGESSRAQAPQDLDRGTVDQRSTTTESSSTIPDA